MTDQPQHGAGRFAPSPSGDLHVGNLRTALLAWLLARSTGRAFALRIDDLDRVRPGAEKAQLRDLSALGLDWDGPIMRQSERRDAYSAAIGQLSDAGLTYPCFCTRREIQEAPSAPHSPPGSYPGTCRELSPAEQSRRAAERPGALRLRSEATEWTVVDQRHGSVTGIVDDLVLLRNDGVPAYNLTVVVDDAAQCVDQVVRGDDLLWSAPRQAYLASLLRLEVPAYVHVPLAVNTAGARLAKRDGAVTISALASRGIDVFRLIADSLHLAGSTPAEALAEFDLATVPADPWVFVPPA
ncbi:MAG: tRNA glutamyl-Q(34) synthetase GluQRS [Aeromicrobium sp.]